MLFVWFKRARYRGTSVKMSSLFPEIVLNLIYSHFSLILLTHTDSYMNTFFFNCNKSAWKRKYLMLQTPISANSVFLCSVNMVFFFLLFKAFCWIPNSNWNCCSDISPFVTSPHCSAALSCCFFLQSDQVSCPTTANECIGLKNSW